MTKLHWGDFDHITNEDIRNACGYLVSEGWDLEAERVSQLWQDYERLKEVSHDLYRQLNTQVPINVEHSKH